MANEPNDDDFEEDKKIAKGRKKRAPPRCFGEVISDIDDGNFLPQCSEAFARVVRASLDTNRQGAITVTLTVKPEHGTIVVVVPRVTTKLPTPSASPTNFYTDEDGNATRHDPRQKTLKFATTIPLRHRDEERGPKS